MEHLFEIFVDFWDHTTSCGLRYEVFVCVCVCGRAVEETVYVFINLLPRANEQNTVKEVLGESEFQPGIILESKIVNFVTSWRFFTPRCFLINLLLAHNIINIPARLNYSCSTLNAFYV